MEIFEISFKICMKFFFWWIYNNVKIMNFDENSFSPTHNYSMVRPANLTSCRVDLNLISCLICIAMPRQPVAARSSYVIKCIECSRQPMPAIYVVSQDAALRSQHGQPVVGRGLGALDRAVQVLPRLALPPGVYTHPILFYRKFRVLRIGNLSSL